MSLQFSSWNDTIVALATPPGVSAIGVIRLSGKDALVIADALFSSKSLAQQKSHTLHVGMLALNGTTIDEVVVSLYKSPRSYTGEDIVEISCHGSPFIQQQVIDACIEKGARLAKPGEFTQRAFLNGKLDLVQAESVADLIASNSQASQRTALNNMRGGFSHALKQLRDQLLSFSALIELELDFSQEDVEFADRTQFKNLIRHAKSQTGDLLLSFKLGNVIRNGVSVAIIGRPNAGKSTLLNALLNEDRAIVSEIAGTTRDTIEEVLNINGILFRLIDTAGIREHTQDVIEGFGIEKSLQKMKEADIVLYLFDASATDVSDLETTIVGLRYQGLNFMLVANKIDEGDEQGIRKNFSSFPQIIFISAKTHSHLEALRSAMTQLVLSDKVSPENVIITNARHYASLKQVDEALFEIDAGLEQGLPGDLLALDIRRCLQYLGEITGEITNEDQLDYIFSKFCIGK